MRARTPLLVVLALAAAACGSPADTPLAAPDQPSFSGLMGTGNRNEPVASTGGETMGAGPYMGSDNLAPTDSTGTDNERGGTMGSGF